MKHTYRIHPENYDVGRMERFYSRMAAKGWRLEKRGPYLSRFRRADPETLTCRIELSGVDGMPEEQIALYEDAGWQLAAHYQFINVFFAPSDSGAPEFYSDPAQQAATYTAIRKSYRNSFIGLFVYTLVYALLIFLGGYGGSLVRFFGNLQLAFFTYTMAMCAVLMLLLSCWYGQLHAVLCLRAVCRRMKSGKPFDHDRSLFPPLRWIGYGLAAAVAVLAALGVWEYISSRPYPMPQERDGPYLLLSDLGYDGERTYTVRESNLSETAHGVTPLASWWDTQEFVELDNGQTAAIYQLVLEVSSPEQAIDLAPALMETSTFRLEFSPVEMDGLDAAWANELDLVAVKGNRVYSITRILPDGEARIILDAIAQCQK